MTKEEIQQQCANLNNIVVYNIRKLAERENISLSKLCKKSGVSSYTWNGIMYSNRIPSTKDLIKNANALDITLSYIVTDHKSPV